MKTAVLAVLLSFLLFSVVWSQVGGGDVVFELKGPGNVTFSHDTHVGMGKQCTDCHDALFVTKEKHKKVSMANMGKGQSCGSCHDGKQAFTVKENCKTCHKK